MHIRSLKFAAPLSMYFLSFYAFMHTGWTIALPLMYAFMFIPLVELVFPAAAGNLSEAEEQVAKNDRLYDLWLYVMVPLQFVALYYFLVAVQDPALSGSGTTDEVIVVQVLTSPRESVA